MLTALLTFYQSEKLKTYFKINAQHSISKNLQVLQEKRPRPLLLTAGWPVHRRRDPQAERRQEEVRFMNSTVLRQRVIPGPKTYSSPPVGQQKVYKGKRWQQVEARIQ